MHLRQFLPNSFINHQQNIVFFWVELRLVRIDTSSSVGGSSFPKWMGSRGPDLDADGLGRSSSSSSPSSCFFLAFLASWALRSCLVLGFLILLAALGP